MKREELISIWLFIASLVLYVVTFISRVASADKSTSVVLLCLGSVFFCLGSVFKQRANKDNKTNE